MNFPPISSTRCGIRCGKLHSGPFSLSYLALGDSYTIGEGVDEAGRWPLQLAQGLRDAGIAIADPRIIATTGWTTDELSAAMDAAEPLGEWDFVSLLIGVNNQYRGRDVDNYVGEFTRLLRRAVALTGDRADRVLVLSIPDWGVTPFAFASGRDRQAIADDLDAYNAALGGSRVAGGEGASDSRNGVRVKFCDGRLRASRTQSAQNSL